jgi:hypothetical protein
MIHNPCKHGLACHCAHEWVATQKTTESNISIGYVGGYKIQTFHLLKTASPQSMLNKHCSEFLGTRQTQAVLKRGCNTTRHGISMSLSETSLCRDIQCDSISQSC